MALRLVEVMIQTEQIDSIWEALEDATLIDSWTAEVGDSCSVISILVEQEHTESITDLLDERFGSQEVFRVVLFAVEATLPQPDSINEATEADDQGGEGAQSANKSAEEEEEEEAPPQRISREELYQDIVSSSTLSSTYLVTVALSTVVAAVGLIRGDVAIIIGAMVIAPLLGPNVALALASTLGDTNLARKAAYTIGAATAVALFTSGFIGFIFEVDATVPDLLSRTQVGPGDVLLALAAGSAGALAFTSGIATGIIGVMVAVALLPPLAAFGLLLGSGETTLALGAGVLFVTNIVCINLAGVVTFLAQKIRPRSWWEAKQAKKATRIAIASWVVALAILLAVMIWFI